MARVALSELIFTATTPPSFAVGRKVTVCARGTETPTTVHSAESGGTTVAQPLVTDRDGRPYGVAGEEAWVEAGSYDLLVAPVREGEETQVLHWEAAKGAEGGGGGGGVTSVNGHTGVVVLKLEELEGTIAEAQLGSESVATGKLKALAVTAAKLAAGAVEAAKIAAGAVTAEKLGPEAVETEKIKEGAVTGSRLSLGAVIENKLGAEAVTAAKIKLLNITEGLLAAEAVGEGKIKALAVSTAKIAAGAVTAAKIASEAVETAGIKAGAVTAAKLGSEAVETAAIKALAVTAAKLGAESVEEGKIKNLAVSASKLSSALTSKIVGKYIIPLGWSIPGKVEVKNYGGLYLAFAEGQTGKLIGIKYKIASGTKAKFSIKKNGTALTGFKELSATTTLATASTAATFTTNEVFELEVESIEGEPVLLIATVYYEVERT